MGPASGGALCLGSKAASAIFTPCEKAAGAKLEITAADADGAQQLRLVPLNKAGEVSGEPRCLSAVLGVEHGVQ